MNSYPPLLIESWLPIAAVGAESQRERGASSALPPLYFLHVWWARRPLITSRAAILAGERLSLLFLAVRPITKVERIGVISQGIRAMTSEEAYYWYSKCTGGAVAERAQKALRVLLATE
jgi:hypothetical protein